MTSSAKPPRYPFECPDPQMLAPAYSTLPAVARVTVMPSGKSAWILTKYEDVRDALRMPEFSRAAADAQEIAGYPPTKGFMLGSDGEAHDRLRDVVKDAFNRESVNARRPSIERAVDDLLETLVARAQSQAGEPVDLIENFSLPLALTTIGDIFGIPHADRKQFREWGDAFLSTSESSKEASRAAWVTMFEYFGTLIAQRKANPTSDLLSVIAQADGLAEQEKPNLPIEIVTAGWETTAAAITNFTLWCLTHGDGDQTYYQYLREHPERIERAVEEMLRMLPVGGADGLPRCALKNVTMSGVTIREGDLVFMSHDAAHRDPKKFPDPGRIDLNRHPNPHLAFNAGRHFCLGASLARLTIRVVLERITQQLPDLQLGVDPGNVDWNSSTSIRVPHALPVRLGSAGVPRPTL